MSEKKAAYLNIRADARLREALEKAAERGGRSAAEQARYLLEIMLGLREPERLEIPTAAEQKKSYKRSLGKAG